MTRLALALLALSCFPQDEVPIRVRRPRAADSRRKVAVVEFPNKSMAPGEKVPQAATEAAVAALTASQQLRVFDRTTAERVKAEMKPPVEGGAPVPLASTDFVVVGSITSFGFRFATKDGVMRRVISVTLDLRVVDVGTGGIVFQKTLESSATGAPESTEGEVIEAAFRAAIRSKLDALLDAMEPAVKCAGCGKSVLLVDACEACSKCMACDACVSPCEGCKSKVKLAERCVMCARCTKCCACKPKK